MLPIHLTHSGTSIQTISLSAGTMPSALAVSIALGNSAPGPNGSDKIRDGIKRTYEIVSTGGSGSSVNANFHYLDNELTSSLTAFVNDETHLTTMDYDIDINGHGAPASDEHGRASFDFTNNFIGLSGVPISYFIYVPTTHEWRTIFTLREYDEEIITWNGSVDNDWKTANNWTLLHGGSSVPHSLSHVIIPDASTTPNDPVLPVDNLTVINTMSIEPGGVLVMNNNIITIQNSLSGGWEDQNAAGNDPGTSKVIFSNPNTSISGNARFYDVEISNGADISNEASSTMKIANSITRVGTGKWFADILDATIEYNGGSQTVLLPDGTPNYHNLILSGSGTKTMPASALSIHGTVTINGTASVAPGGAMTIGQDLVLGSGTTFTAGSYTHSIAGNFVNNGTTLTTTGSTIVLNGSAGQTIGGTASSAFNNLTLNNAAGVQIDNSVTVNGTLDLTSGKLTMGNNNLTLNTTTAVAGSPGSSNYIVYSGSGRVIKYIPGTMASAYLFPIGTAANYSPATFKLNSGTVDGSSYLTLNVTEGKQANIGSTPNYINRYWTITPSGTFTSPDYDATFTYLHPDVVGNEGSMKAAKYNGSWTMYSVVNTVDNVLSVTGATSFSDYTGFSDLNAAPSATVNPICSGGATTVSANATGGSAPYSYAWTPDQGNVASFDPSPALTGTTTYSVTVTDNDGATATGSVTVTVNPLPSATISYDGSPYCATGTASVTRSGQAGGTYSSTAGLDINSSTGEINLVTSTAGTYTVTYSFSDGTCSNTTTTSVTINPLPSITFTAEPGASACINTDVTYTTQSGMSNYEWNVSGTLGVDFSITSGGLSTDNSITLKYLTTGDKTATVNYTNENGCTAASAVSSIATTVYAQPDAANAGADQTQCATSTFTLAGNAASVGAGVWTITSGAGSITTPASPTSTVTGVTAGQTTVLRWTITNGSCSSFDEVSLTNDVAVTVSAAGTDQAQCATSTFTLAGNTAVSGTGTWTITSGAGSITDAASPTTTVTGVTAGQTTILRWTITNGSCSSFDEVSLTNDVAVTVAAAGTDQAQCATSTFTLAGNTALSGTGVWTITSGAGAITDPLHPHQPL
ncbi:MAG: hypothetical protein IPP93_06415 [Chitinophagaceae bacterium]|nr:hypothetical protein [Chitinophagaceae bacterium]